MIWERAIFLYWSFLVQHICLGGIFLWIAKNNALEKQKYPWGLLLGFTYVPFWQNNNKKRYIIYIYKTCLCRFGNVTKDEKKRTILCEKGAVRPYYYIYQKQIGFRKNTTWSREKKMLLLIFLKKVAAFFFFFFYENTYLSKISIYLIVIIKSKRSKSFVFLYRVRSFALILNLSSCLFLSIFTSIPLR